ncbi:MAG: hypothetical protein ACRCXX_01725, partial [Cetobacterium sp.]|uniref:hypothetical protein n=1 Tax=Cetobacterium sp. TaxID=2071632 RepID=UPI003F35DA30
MSVLNKRNLNECLYDPSISVNTLDETIMTEAYLQTSLVNTNPESYRFQPARLSSLYFDFLKSNVFDKDMSEYKHRTIIIPVDMWLSVDEVPKNITDFNVKQIKNIVLYMINWLSMGKLRDIPEMNIVFTANGAMTMRSSHNTDKVEEFLQLLVRMLKLKDPVGENKLGGVEENIPAEMEQTEEMTTSTVKNSIVDAVINLYNSNKNVVGFTGETTDVVVNDQGEEEGKVMDLDAELVPEDEIVSDAVKVVSKVTDEAVANNPDAPPEAIINIVDSDVVAIKAIDKMKKDML